MEEAFLDNSSAVWQQGLLEIPVEGGPYEGAPPANFLHRQRNCYRERNERSSNTTSKPGPSGEAHIGPTCISGTSLR
jgi:hypothetical protein